MAEIFVFCLFRSKSTLFCAGVGSTAPHEVAALAFQWVRNCDVISAINAVGLPVVAMSATPGCVEGRISQAAWSLESPPHEGGTAKLRRRASKLRRH